MSLTRAPGVSPSCVQHVRAAREAIEELTQEDLPIEVQQTLSRNRCSPSPNPRLSDVLSIRLAAVEMLQTARCGR